MTHVFEGEFVHQNLGRIRKEFRVDQMCEWEKQQSEDSFFVSMEL